MSGFFDFDPDAGSLAIGLLVGVLLSVGISYLIGDEVDRSCRDQRNVEQLCIDGNDNACRVMEVRRG